MKRGHVCGTRKVSAKDSAWYKAIEEENIRKIEAEWQAKHAVQHKQAA
jgi:hypothetical protein